jgi:hypothetical protein
MKRQAEDESSRINIRHTADLRGVVVMNSSSKTVMPPRSQRRHEKAADDVKQNGDSKGKTKVNVEAVRARVASQAARLSTSLATVAW